MENAIPIRKIWFYLSLAWLLVGLITHISAILWMIQYREEVSLYTILDIGFYYHIPAFLWILYTPILLRWYIRRPLWGRDWGKNLAIHLLISLLLSPIARILAIGLDFSIKNVIGMEPKPAWEIVYQARFIVLGSAPRAFLYYWVVIGAVIGWEYFYLRRQPKPQQQQHENNRKQLVVPHKASKKMVNVQDILWIEADRNYVNIHTMDHCYKLRQSLASLLDELDQQQFYQIHRSKAVNKAAIESLSHWRRGEYLIRLKNEKLLSSTRTYRHNIQHILAG